MQNWRGDFEWQRQYLAQMQAIIGQFLVREAPWQEDARHNTDLIVLRSETIRVACRARRYESYQHRWAEFTVRSRRRRAETELPKLLSGWGDYFLYGFGKATGQFVLWTLADLDVFRATYQLGMGEPLSNPDGSSDFLAFAWSEFPPEFIVAESEDKQHRRQAAREDDGIWHGASPAGAELAAMPLDEFHAAVDQIEADTVPLSYYQKVVASRKET